MSHQVRDQMRDGTKDHKTMRTFLDLNTLSIHFSLYYCIYRFDRGLTSPMHLISTSVLNGSVFTATHLSMG